MTTSSASVLSALATRVEAGALSDELWKEVSAVLREAFPTPAGSTMMIYWPDVPAQLRALAAQQDRQTEKQG